MANKDYQTIGNSVQKYLNNLPQGLHLTKHTRTTDTGHYLILHFGNANTPRKSAIENGTTRVKQETFEPMEHYMESQTGSNDLIPETTITKDEPIGNISTGNVSMVKEEPMEYETTATVKMESDRQHQIKQEPKDVKPIIWPSVLKPKLENGVKREIISEMICNEENENRGKKIKLNSAIYTDNQNYKSESQSGGVFSRLGVKQEVHNETNKSFSRRQRRKFRQKKNKNNWHKYHHKENKGPDLREYLNQKKDVVPKDLRQLIPRQVPFMIGSHECFFRKTSYWSQGYR